MSQLPQADTMGAATPETRQAYDAYVAEVRIRNSKVACVLVMVLMPAGFLLDSFVYADKVIPFLIVRFMASLLAGLVFVGLTRPNLKAWQYQLLCMGWWVLPAASISWMIAVEQGMVSPYYAGLNLVILAVSSVIQATLADSIIAVVVIVLMYCAACGIHPFIHPAEYAPKKLLFNNLYFISLTSIIVVTGNYFFNQLRFREFMLRFELNRSRALLAENNEKLMELDQIKNRFFANISHELRTPLTLLLSPLETMMHSRSLQFDAPTRSLFSIMQANGMRLLKLINDLLDLVRLESGRMDVKREPLEMTAFVRSMIGAAQQMADNKKLKLEYFVQPDLGPVMLDRDKLEKTVLNLVFNALKFTPASGTVSLRVEKPADHLVISVADTGVGIAEKNLPFVFDRFWQADNSSKRKYQGVGIGLSLVKELTELHGGTVSVVSQEGKGTTFTVNLPFTAGEAIPTTPAPSMPVVLPETNAVSIKPNDMSVQPAAVATASAEPAVQSEEWLANLYRRAELFPALATSEEAVQPLRARSEAGLSRLLVADDEPDMLRFLKSQLSTHYDVIEATDGAQAFDKAGQYLPDIILLDMNMPEKDGLQVCRELRQQAATQNIPIIILTARADEETKLTALSAGANDFLAKPFSTSELHVRVKNLVESHHYREKLAKQNTTLAKTIDQLKETETLLVQTEKMASLGRMSAGIMHEINNPLNFAATGLFTLQNKRKYVAAEQQEEYAEVVKEVEEGILRVKTIVGELKTFTHPDAEQLELVGVQTTINSALRFLSSEWKDRIQIEQKLPPRLRIRGNRNKLLQIFVNLFQNSLDALKHKQFAGEKPTICIDGFEEGGKVRVSVRDNGEGIKPETINKVFDPFFTTKDVGEGMGLGLTICYRIVQEYGGRISVQSECGKYTEFTMEFPNYADPAVADATSGEKHYEQPA